MEEACLILQKTNDGNDLSSFHLALVQCKVNGELNKDREAEFNKLYEMVKLGNYTPSWFYGVEHLVKKDSGYVYWRGICVEHFSFHGNHEAEKLAAIALGEKCKKLEARNIPVNFSTVFMSQ